MAHISTSQWDVGVGHFHPVQGGHFPKGDKISTGQISLKVRTEGKFSTSATVEDSTSSNMRPREGRHTTVVECNEVHLL